jgi:hypothetical protein
MEAGITGHAWAVGELPSAEAQEFQEGFWVNPCWSDQVLNYVDADLAVTRDD